MDTKSKNNNIASTILSIILLIICVTGSLFTYPAANQYVDSAVNPFYESEVFLMDVKHTFSKYYCDLKQKQSSQAVTAADILIPDYVKKAEKLEKELAKIAAENQTPESTLRYQELEQELHHIRNYINDTESRVWNFGNNDLYRSNDVLFYALDEETGISSTNSPGDLSVFLKDIAISPDEPYQYILAVEFDKNGTFHILNSSAGKGSTAQSNHLLENIWIENLPTPPSFADKSTYTAPVPKNFQLVLAIADHSILCEDGYYSDRDRYWENAFMFIWFGMLGLAALLGLIIGLTRLGTFADNRFFSALPLEGVIALDALLVVWPYTYVCSLARYTAYGQLEHYLASHIPNADISRVLAWGVNFLCWFVLLGTAYLSFVYYARIFRTGFWKYLRTRSWCIRLVCWIGGLIKKFWDVCTTFKLETSADKTLMKIILLNMVIVILISCAWFVGVPLAIIYSVFLYFFIRKKYRKIQKDYQTVLHSSEQIASGNLDIQSDEGSDAGIFTKLNENLCRVRSGFKKAVDTEVKSQNMKTELITNVSHDLKTPLTAIITYVDLLKDENLTPEQRRAYVDTLDQKSQRLKQLITDLFDLSKAASQNITPDLTELDLNALLSQVRFELDDTLSSSEIDFRWKLPDCKVPVLLDGQRTCRIFENLLINITKYAMPHTRAYISLDTCDGMAEVTMKNISADELNGNVSDFTERFVRGDASRSTEGSGLGLAIAKSFAELQSGTFDISADGDLFKVRILWPLHTSDTPEQPCPTLSAVLSDESNTPNDNIEHPASDEAFAPVVDAAVFDAVSTEQEDSIRKLNPADNSESAE